MGLFNFPVSLLVLKLIELVVNNFAMDNHRVELLCLRLGQDRLSIGLHYLYFTKGLEQVTHCEWKIVVRHNSTICLEIHIVFGVFRNQTEQLEHIHTLLLR